MDGIDYFPVEFASKEFVAQMYRRRLTNQGKLLKQKTVKIKIKPLILEDDFNGGDEQD